MPLRIGVAGLQGDVSEHVRAVEDALEAEDRDGEVRRLRAGDGLDDVDGVVLPGGESTTISRLLRKADLQDPLRERARREDLPVLATCAGMILLASEGDEQVEETDTELLGLLDVAVDRNFFGGQRESFQHPVSLDGLEDPFEAVFIRAPAARRAWGRADVLGRLPPETASAVRGDPVDEPPAVAVRQGNRVAYAFHPELTPDLRLHRRWVRRVARWADGEPGQE